MWFWRSTWKLEPVVSPVVALPSLPQTLLDHGWSSDERQLLPLAASSQALLFFAWPVLVFLQSYQRTGWNPFFSPSFSQPWLTVYQIPLCFFYGGGTVSSSLFFPASDPLPELEFVAWVSRIVWGVHSSSVAKFLCRLQ